MNVHARPRWSASVFPDVDDDGSTGAFVGRMSLNAARSELETAGERQREIDGFMAVENKKLEVLKVVGAGLYRGNFGRHGDNGAAAMAACRRRS